MILIFSENVIFFENEIDVETFKSSESSFNWFNDEATCYCHDWFAIKMLKTIDERSFRERMSAIWRDTNISISFN